MTAEPAGAKYQRRGEEDRAGRCKEHSILNRESAKGRNEIVRKLSVSRCEAPQRAEKLQNLHYDRAMLPYGRYDWAGLPIFAWVKSSRVKTESPKPPATMQPCRPSRRPTHVITCCCCGTSDALYDLSRHGCAQGLDHACDPSGVGEGTAANGTAAAPPPQAPTVDRAGRVGWGDSRLLRGDRRGVRAASRARRVGVRVRRDRAVAQGEPLPASHRPIEFNSRFCRGCARQESLFR